MGLTAERLRSVVHYDATTGVFTWKVKLSSRSAVGRRAGFARDDAYRLIGIDGEIYLEHRLAWLYVTGVWPIADIDHEDVDPGNNRFANLREASHSQNHCNIAKPATNTSGFKGAVWHKKDRVWQAQIKLRGKNHYLGRHPSAEAAHAAYVEASKKLHGVFGRVQ